MHYLCVHFSRVYKYKWNCWSVVIYYCETCHSKSKWLKTAVVYYFLLILWVYWKILLLGVGGLTHMSAFSWAQLEQHCSAVYGGSWAHSACTVGGSAKAVLSRRPHLVASLGFLIWQLTENKGGIRKMSWSLSMRLLQLSLLLLFFGQRNSQRHPRFKEWKSRLCLLMGRAVKYRDHVSSIYCIYLLLH